MISKIGILFSSYGPYHLSRVEGYARYKSVRDQFKIYGIELARSQTQYPWKIDINNPNFLLTSVVKNQCLEKTNIVQLIIKLNQTLNYINPSIIAIAGYFQPSMIFALFWCLWHGKPAILFSETTEADAPRVWWREAIKRWLVNQYKAVLVGGKPHKRYMIKLGVPEEAIFLGYDVVGNENFHPNQIKHLSRPINIPYFLAINRFVPKKNLSFLISAYAEYRQKVGNSAWDIVLCGDGELRPQIEKQITDLNLSNYIHLPGFLQQNELLPYFAHARCFIHASIQEQWGLVVNEAMAAGLPVLVSNRCGCCEDLILEGINGFSFNPENFEELTQLMVKISSNVLDLEAMGQASLKHIQKFSPDYFAQGLMQAVNYALEHS